MIERPNIVIFMPDQLRADCVGCFGNPFVHTPHIDALAARGMRFENAYVNHPVCSPSRVNLMTGWYPHTRGHRTLTHLVQPHEPNLLRYFKDNGYNVAWVGQRGDVFAPGVTEASTHFHGWYERPAQNFMGPQYEPGSALYNAYYHGRRPDRGEPWLDFDEATIRSAERWLAEGPAGPWILFIALLFPHLPFEVEDPWYSMYRDMPVHDRIRVADGDGKPAFHQALRDKCGYDRLTDDEWLEIIRVYYGMISRVDAQLGRVVEAVDRAGATDSTSLFFLTDHGEFAGDYNLVEKWPSGLDRSLTWNPLIAHVPGGATGSAATFAEMVDILPTLLELGGIDAAHTHFGRSLVPALADPGARIRDAAFSEGGFHTADAHLFEQSTGVYANKAALQSESPATVGKAFAMRDARWTYVYRLFEDDELYDRHDDPQETTNLAADPANGAILADCRARMLEWLAATSDVIPWDSDPRFPKTATGHHDPFAG